MFRRSRPKQRDCLIKIDDDSSSSAPSSPQHTSNAATGAKMAENRRAVPPSPLAAHRAAISVAQPRGETRTSNEQTKTRTAVNGKENGNSKTVVKDLKTVFANDLISVEVVNEQKNKDMIVKSDGIVGTVTELQENSRLLSRNPQQAAVNWFRNPGYGTVDGKIPGANNVRNSDPAGGTNPTTANNKVSDLIRRFDGLKQNFERPPLNKERTIDSGNDTPSPNVFLSKERDLYTTCQRKSSLNKEHRVDFSGRVDSPQSSPAHSQSSAHPSLTSSPATPRRTGCKVLLLNDEQRARVLPGYSKKRRRRRRAARDLWEGRGMSEDTQESAVDSALDSDLDLAALKGDGKERRLQMGSQNEGVVKNISWEHLLKPFIGAKRVPVSKSMQGLTVHSQAGSSSSQDSLKPLQTSQRSKSVDALAGRTIKKSPKSSQKSNKLNLTTLAPHPAAFSGCAATVARRQSPSPLSKRRSLRQSPSIPIINLESASAPCTPAILGVGGSASSMARIAAVARGRQSISLDQTDVSPLTEFYRNIEGRVHYKKNNLKMLRQKSLVVSMEEGTVKSQEAGAEEEEKLTRRKRAVNCCRTFIAFLFSTVGLSCLLVGYAILGGFIFRRLEAPNEDIVKAGIQKTIRHHVELLWNVTEELNVLHPGEWTTVAESILVNFTREIYLATKSKGWDGNPDSEQQDEMWSYPGSLLYSITVITTIGYGHITPKTWMGRVVTMLYAIMGIPLTLLTVTNLGGFMATAFRLFYSKVCCGLCCLCFEARRLRQAALPNDIIVTSSSGKVTSRSVSAYPSDVIVTSSSGKVTSRSRSVSSSRDSIGDKRGSLGKESNSINEAQWGAGLRKPVPSTDPRDIRVPIYISFLLIVGYIAIGAVVFSIWEEWGLLIGAYFCFITLSTIGFGDYVPGTSLDAWNSQEKLIFCALYLIFGLALIAMCFDLMQEEARRKFRSIGRKLGLLDKHHI